MGTIKRVDGAAAVILAAGKGTRMRSSLPKVLHPICGVPMVLWAVRAAQAAGAERIVVVGGPDRALEGELPEGVAIAVQERADGTGGALEAALGDLAGANDVVVLAGDVPLVDAATIAALLEAHRSAGAAATVATMVLDDPSGYGRVVRAADGGVERIVETKNPEDATQDELAIAEVNTGLIAFTVDGLGGTLGAISTANAQGERYLPDAIPLLRESGLKVGALEVTDSSLTIGINDRADLAHVAAIAQRRIQARHMAAGVTIEAPESVVIEADVEIAPDAKILAGSILRGATTVGAAATIGPHTVVEHSQIGEGANVVQSHLNLAVVGDGVSVGPFAYLRPGADLAAGSKAGTFVEIKNSKIGEGAKVPHLSYIGDADVGEGANLGASTITANYDGKNKHRTVVGKNARTGVHTSLVAPVELGDEAVTGAGSAITEDLPDGALGIARPRQTNIDDYANRGE